MNDDVMNDGPSRPSAKLLWSDPRTGAECELALSAGSSASIGRAAANDVHIPEKRVSRQHARLSCDEGRFHIHDLDSTNGTSVNSQPIRAGQAHPLQDGDVITFGAAEARFHLGEQKQGAGA